jgi:predicted dinucleotide-binding enzyme
VSAALERSESAGREPSTRRCAKKEHRMSTIGLIGSGLIGSTVARPAAAAGHDVVLSNRRGPDTLKDLVADLGPRARAATPAEAAEAGDLVVVTVPLHACASVPPLPCAGRP